MLEYRVYKLAAGMGQMQELLVASAELEAQ